MAGVRIENVEKSFGSVKVIRNVDIEARRRRIRRARRSLGLRQVDAAAHDRGPRGDHQRTDQDRRSGGQQPQPEGSRHRDGLPELCALSAHDGAGEHGVLARPAEGSKKPERDARVDRAASILGIRQLLDRRPGQLSGGQRQRVAMGRAIVRDPQVFLFDEPLSNLDAKLRVQMRGEIRELHRRLGTTCIYVTHDQIEAMTMADRIVVMHDGVVEQVGRAARALRPTRQSVRRVVSGLARDEFHRRAIGGGRPAAFRQPKRSDSAAGARVRMPATARSRLRLPPGSRLPDAIRRSRCSST